MQEAVSSSQLHDVIPFTAARRAATAFGVVKRRFESFTAWPSWVYAWSLTDVGVTTTATKRALAVNPSTRAAASGSAHQQTRRVPSASGMPERVDTRLAVAHDFCQARRPLEGQAQGALHRLELRTPVSLSGVGHGWVRVVRQRLDGQRIPIRTPFGGHGEEILQSEGTCEGGLQTVARVFVNQVRVIGVRKSPVRASSPPRSRHQRMADLVENELRQTVVGVEIICGRQSQGAGTVPRGVNVGRSRDGHTEVGSAAQPHEIERILVTMPNWAVHDSGYSSNGSPIDSNPPIPQS